MDEFDIWRAQWFRENVRFVEYGLIDRRSLWSSWEKFCERNQIATRSKSSMWRWLLAIGARKHGYLFRRIRMFVPMP